MNETYLNSLENFKDMMSYDKFIKQLQGPLTEQEQRITPFSSDKEEIFQVPYRRGYEPEEQQ